MLMLLHNCVCSHTVYKKSTILFGCTLVDVVAVRQQQRAPHSTHRLATLVCVIDTGALNWTREAQLIQ